MRVCMNYTTDGERFYDKNFTPKEILRRRRRRGRRRDSLATSARTRPVGGRVFRRVIFFHFPSPLPGHPVTPPLVPTSRFSQVGRPPARPSARPSRRALCPHTCDGFSPVTPPGRRIRVPFFRTPHMFRAPASGRQASGIRGRRRRPPAAGLSVILRGHRARGGLSPCTRYDDDRGGGVERCLFVSTSPPARRTPAITCRERFSATAARDIFAVTYVITSIYIII